MTGLFGAEALFAFDWQLALRGDPLTDAEMAPLAGGDLADAPAARQLDRGRPGGRPQGPQAADPHRHGRPQAARGRAHRRASTSTAAPLEVHRRGQPAQGPRAAARRRRPAPRSSRRPGCAATLRDYQRHGLTWLAELTGARPRRLPGRRHGARQDDHPDRAAPAPARPQARAGPDAGGLPGVAARQLGARDRAVRARRRRSAASTAAAAHLEDLARRRVRAHHLRHDAARRRARSPTVAVGPGRRRRGPARQERRAPPPPATLRTIPARGPGRAHRHPGGEQPDRALGDPRLGDPRAARQPQAFRKVWAGADRVAARDADQGAPVRRPGRAVPAAPPQVRPRHRARAAAEDRDRPPARADPRAGGALRGVRPRHDGAHRARRRGRPGAGWCSRCSPGSSRSATTRRTTSSRPAAGSTGRSEKLDLLDELLGTDPRRGRRACWSSPSTSRWPGCSSAHLAARGDPAPVPARRHPGARARGRWCARFQAGEVPVFLLSLKAGGTGLNLTRADHVVHFDRWWNPAVEDQATDRAYRIGQTRPVQVHRLVTEGTIEEKIAELLRPQARARRRRARLAARPR